MSELNIGEFVDHGTSTGNKYLDQKKWKKEGSIVVWLSTRAKMYASYTHGFKEYRTYKDKNTGEEKDVLGFFKVVSPDRDIVCESQYFYDDNGQLKVPPVKDPFLLLREWLRQQDQMSFEQPIFKWTDPKDNSDIIWRRGTLARLIKKSDRKRDEWDHSLDAKLEYLFAVVEDANPGNGVQIERVTKALGDAMKLAIKECQDSKGDDLGNPIKNPYAFKWVYDKGAPIKDMYRAYVFERAELTDAIRAQITSDEIPDMKMLTEPRQGDKARVRAAFEAAAQIDLPYDLLFNDAWEDDGGTEFPPKDETPKETAPKQERTPEVKGPKRRRKKKKQDPPPPPPEPKVEMLPCDDCGKDIPASAMKCQYCGAEYEDTEGDDSLEVSSAEKKSPESKSQVTLDDTTCWACQEINSIVDGVCKNCGTEAADDIPFD